MVCYELGGRGSFGKNEFGMDMEMDKREVSFIEKRLDFV